MPWLRSLRQRLFSRRFAMGMGAALAVLSAAILVNAIGIRLVGDVVGWNRWLTDHRLHFLAWRLCLYGSTAYGWWWMRKRIHAREPHPQSQARLRRAEIAAVATLLLLETSMLFQRP